MFHQQVAPLRLCGESSSAGPLLRQVWANGCSPNQIYFDVGW